MPINSRSKGNRNERKVAEMLSKWTNRKFARTPSSGGLQWKSSFSKGDIICTKEGHFFPFCVEVKAHKEIDFSHLINPQIKLPKILEFWKQCKRDADACNKIPMLLMRYDRMPSDLFFLALPTYIYHQFAVKHPLKNKMALGYTNTSLDLNITIIPSNWLFELPYKDIKSLAKTYLKNGKKK